jgi:transcriptional regulator with XRE-family HTH domain
MLNGSTIKPTSPDRQDRLNAWLALNRLSRGKIAERIGVSRSMIGQILSGQKRPASRIRQLIELGIPEELLPKIKSNGKK